MTADGAKTDVGMGQIAEVGAPSWVFTNVASYTVPVCDASGHFACTLFVPQLD